MEMGCVTSRPSKFMIDKARNIQCYKLTHLQSVSKVDLTVFIYRTVL